MELQNKEEEVFFDQPTEKVETNTVRTDGDNR